MRSLALLLLGASPLLAQGPAAPAAPRQIALRFAATVGEQPFACGTWYPLGRTGARAAATDFRFYLHDIELVRADGSAEPLSLTQDGLWQDGAITLLDFEDGSGPCANGTAERHTEVTGTVPAGSYTGVRFRVGVPFDRNHLDLATQRSPLTLSRLYWSWTTGYKFMRIDFRVERPDTSATSPWLIHLGSTGCARDGEDPRPSSCSDGNRPSIALTDIDPDRDVIRFDLAALVAGADLLGNQPQTAVGCMSGPDDTDCAPVFQALGLAHPTSRSPAVQRAFTVQRPGR